MYDDVTLEELKELLTKELKVSQLEVERTKQALDEDMQKLYVHLDIAYEFIGRSIASATCKEDIVFFTRSLMFEVRDLEYKIYSAKRDDGVEAATDEYMKKFEKETEFMSPAEVVLYEADIGLAAVRDNIKIGDTALTEDDISGLTLCAEKLRLALESGDDVMIALEHKSTDNEIKKLLEKMLSIGYGV